MRAWSTLNGVSAGACIRTLALGGPVVPAPAPPRKATRAAPAIACPIQSGSAGAQSAPIARSYIDQTASHT